MQEVTHSADHIPSPSTAHWRADSRFFAHEVPQHHKDALHQVNKAQCAHAVAALNAQVPPRKNDDIVRQQLLQKRDVEQRNQYGREVPLSADWNQMQTGDMQHKSSPPCETH